MSRKIRLGVIGAGLHSRLHHGSAIRRLRERIGRVAVADLNPAAAREYAEQFGFDAWYAGAGEMIEAEKPEALIVVTPENVTPGMFRELLPYRLPMLMEKPFGRNAAESEQLCILGREAGARVMISFNRRFSPVCRRLSELLQGQGAFHVRGAMFRHARTEADFPAATGVHLIDTLHFLGKGEAAVVAAQESAGGLSALLRFPLGVTGELLLAPCSGSAAECYEITGQDFRIEADYFRGYTFSRDGKVVEHWEIPPEMPLEVREGAEAELIAFLDGIESGEFPVLPGDALAAARIAERISIERKS